MTTKTENYILSAGLVEVLDPETENPICRRPGFEGVTEFAGMDKAIGEALLVARKAQGLSRPELAPLLGLTPQVYGRYERGEAKLHVTRLVHLCELLDFSPSDLIYSVAPHLWGASGEEANARRQLMKHIEGLPFEKTKLLLQIVESLLTLQSGDNASKED